jgi:hypothetical protein
MDSGDLATRIRKQFAAKKKGGPMILEKSTCAIVSHWKLE